MKSKLHSKSKFSRQRVLVLAGLLAITGIVIILFARADALDTVEGELEVSHNDLTFKITSRDEYFVKQKSGERTLLRFDDGVVPENLLRAQGRRNTTVRAKGRKEAGTLQIPASKSPLGLTANSQAFAAPSGQSNSNVQVLNAPSALPLAVGRRRVAIIMYNASNDARQPYTPEQIRQLVFTGANSVNDDFKDQSSGKTSLVGALRQDGDIFGWTTAQESSSSCNDSQWSNYARQQAETQGFVDSNYDHVITLTFPHKNCDQGNTGGALVGQKSAYIINGAYATEFEKNHLVKGFAHEIGHNMGLAHANSWQCLDSANLPSPLVGNCYAFEYADQFDVMGGGMWHFSNFARSSLGWLEASSMATVSTSGEYTINTIDSASNSLRLLRVPFGDGKYLYLERRSQPPKNLEENNPPVYEGIHLRRAGDYGNILSDVGHTTSGGQRTLSSTATLIAVDTTESQGSTIFEDSAASLKVGRSFYDPIGRTMISLLSETANSARVKIDLNASAPALAGASLNVNGKSSETAQVGQEVTLNWSSQNATSCKALSDPGFYMPNRPNWGYIIASDRSNHSLNVYFDRPQAVTYTLHCINAAGIHDIKQVTVNYIATTSTPTPTPSPTVRPTVTPTPTRTPSPTTTPSPTVRPSVTPTPTPAIGRCPKGGDLSDPCDGQINIFDLSRLLAKWGTSDPRADLSNPPDGTVNIFDLSILLSNWGK